MGRSSFEFPWADIFPLLLERCPPRQKSRVERLNAEVEPLLTEATCENSVKLQTTHAAVERRPDRLRVCWLNGFITHSWELSGRGTTRAEDAQGTLTQSHKSPSILVYEQYISPLLLERCPPRQKSRVERLKAQV